MSRYVSQITNLGAQYSPGYRPPLDLLPAPLPTLLLEHDDLAERVAKARAHATQLASEDLDHRAWLEDDAAATGQARAGKPIPKTRAATVKLADDREHAAAAVAALESAFKQCKTDLMDATNEHCAARWDARRLELEKARARIEAQAHKLADAVEEAVTADAVDDWIAGGAWTPDAMTWPDHVVDLSAHGGLSLNRTPINVRAAIVRAATTCLESETTHVR